MDEFINFLQEVYGLGNYYKISFSPSTNIVTQEFSIKIEIEKYVFPFPKPAKLVRVCSFKMSNFDELQNGMRMCLEEMKYERL